MTGKVILIAGGAGFIGSHLCASLLKKDNYIVCVDNITTGSDRNIKPLISNRKFKFVKSDVCGADFVQNFKKQHIDEIYHLASPASVTYITEYPVEAALANSIGTKNLLELARTNNAEILFASSSEVYGDPKEHPQNESYRGNVNPVGVRSGYDEGKRFGEALCMAYHREFGVKVKIVRIFNTYGPNSSPADTRVIPQFIVQALRNQPLTVHGDGQQTRSFCYVSDMVSGFIKMMESTEIGPINLGNLEEYKITDVAWKIIEEIGSSSKIKFVQRPQDDPAKRRPDLTSALKKLNWSPIVPFEEGLLKTIEYFRKIIKS